MQNRSTVFIFFCLILFLNGCATVPPPQVPSEGEAFLKNLCESHSISCQWDSGTQSVTLKHNDVWANLMVGSDLVLIGEAKIILSAPVRIERSTIIVPADFKEKVLLKFLQAPARKAGYTLPRIREVIIDPGHGGKDPGAIGRSGLREKDVNLDISKRLKRILEKHHIKVKMTRSSDEFITLGKRTEIASESKADLFISIHANANPAKSVSGMEVYSSKDLDSVDRREEQRAANHKILFNRTAMAKDSPILETIVSDMFYDNKQAESKNFAYHMAQRASAIAKTENLGSKRARFYVLRNTLIPAILIEVGFLSNPKEEKLLQTHEYRQKLAYGIARGILEYLYHE